MDKYIFDEGSGLWYELIGDYYFPCLTVPTEEKTVKKNRCCMVCWLPCSSGFCWDYSVEFLARQTGICQRGLFQYSTVFLFTS